MSVNNAGAFSAFAENPPPSFDSSELSNSCSVNQYGDIVALCADGTLKFASLRTNSSAKKGTAIHDLPVENAGELSEYRFTNIEFNADGTILLLWSKSVAGIIEIPRTFAPDGTMDINSNAFCKFSLIATEYLHEHAEVALTMAKFHPLSSSHVVLLLRGILLVIDIFSEDDSRLIPVGLENRFVSFSFGPDIDWLKFTIFLLTEKAEVFAVNPVIPRGAIVSQSVVSDLWSWIDEQHLLQGDESRGQAYTRHVSSYLCAMFGPRSEVEQQQEITQQTDRNTYIVAGDYLAKSGGLFAELEAFYLTPPAVQGPFTAERPLETSATGNNSRTTQSRVATEICVPRVRGDGAPVITICFSNGDVEFLLMTAQEHGQGSSILSPCWVSDNDNNDNNSSNSSSSSALTIRKRRSAGLQLQPPTLLLVETVPVAEAAAATAATDSVGGGGSGRSSDGQYNWTIVPDPVVAHCFHVINRRLGASYLLSCTWLLRCLESSEEQDTSLPSSNRGSRGGARRLYDSNERGAEEYKKSYTGDDDHYDHDDDIGEGYQNFKHSTCVPVFVAPSTSSSSRSPSKALAVQGASGSSLSAFAVAYDHFDSMPGHLAIFRDATGVMTAVNVAAHTRLCQLQVALEETKAVRDDDNSSATLAAMGSAAWSRATQQLLLDAVEGLRATPFPSKAPQQSSVQSSKDLILASQHLEKTVMTPLQELSRRIRYRVDVLQDTYAAQVELLNGTTSAGDAAAGDASSSPGVASTSSAGIRGSIRDLAGRQEELRSRMERIQGRFQDQRERVNAVLSGALRTKTKLSHAELQYKRQLDEWLGLVRHMDTSVDSLRRQAKEQVRAMQIETPTQTPSSTPGGGGVGPAGVLLGTPGTVGRPPLTSRTIYSPRGGSFVPTTPSTPGSVSLPPGSAAYKSPGFGGGPQKPTPSSSAMSTAGPGNGSTHTSRVGLGGIPFGSPLGRPSLASPTPAAAAGSAAKPVGAGTAAGAAAIPFGNRVLRTPAKGSEAASTANPTTSSSAVFGTPTGGATGAAGAGTLRNRPESTISTAAIAGGQIVVTEEDVELFTKQLTAQEKMLKNAQDSVVALEERLAVLRGSGTGTGSVSIGAAIAGRGHTSDTPI